MEGRCGSAERNHERVGSHGIHCRLREDGNDGRYRRVPKCRAGLRRSQGPGRLAPGHQPPRWPDPGRPQQIHLDLDVADLDEAEARAIEIGATKHEHQPSEDDEFRVFLDPAGHPFCLCRT
ncbi:VOC family protein [Nonomuraea solani]|uniref:VOC family protein n=1 Tax=Nonomuraea solani TaxID=1144553 RepID=UPI00135AEC2E|nr:VOC family protein [Nonomuraea solani]